MAGAATHASAVHVGMAYRLVAAWFRLTSRGPVWVVQRLLRRVVLITVQCPIELQCGAALAFSPGDSASNNMTDLPSSNPSRAQDEDHPPQVIPPVLPPELLLPEGANEPLMRLEAIWRQATPDTIGGDLEAARRLAETIESEDAEVARRYVTALIRLEHWLRDR